MAAVFISHASADQQLAEQVLGWLTGDHQVFLDSDLRAGITVGEQWQQRLYERLRWADAVVCLITPAYLASPWCAAEVAIADHRGSRLLPLRVTCDLTHPLLSAAVYQYADLAEPGAARARLGEALARLDAAGGRGWPDDRSPFPGLRAFDADLHRVFFGRHAETGALAALLRSPAEQVEGRLLIVEGPSGCGKSSLVRAGLLPMMADEPGWWALPAFVPGTDPVEALARELTDAGKQLGSGWTLREVRTRLGQENGLGELAGELLLAAPGSGRRRLLVVIDQLEELLTITSDEDRARFAGLLRRALAAGSVRAVATLRPEFLSPLLANPELAGLKVQTFPLRPLPPEALATVIKQPAELAGIEVDAELVTRMAADTKTGEALPLLAYTLAELAKGVGRGGQLSATRYTQLGGVPGALRSQAEEALTAAMTVCGRTREQVLAGLLNLVTLDEQGQPTRMRVGRAQLLDPVATELDAFITRRLLSTDTIDGVDVVEVVHEAFLSEWPSLGKAIREAGTALRTRRQVEAAADEWGKNGQLSGRLWERGQLAAALADLGAHIQPARQTGHRDSPHAWLASGWRRPLRWLPNRHRTLVTDKVTLSRPAGDFLYASIRRDRHRRRRATTVLSLLLVAALAAAGVAFAQRNTAQQRQKVAVARGLVAQADAARATDPRTALLLGIAAHRLHNSPETQASLVTTLTSTHYAGSLTGHTGGVSAVAFASDGRTLATGSTDQTAILWDVADRARPHQLAQLTGHTIWVSAVTFASDGRTLATGSRDGTAILAELVRRQALAGTEPEPV